MAQEQLHRASGVSKRGFASMDPERQREIARKGGASVPGEKRSFSQDRSLAAQAGRKGGEASHGTRNRVIASPPAAKPGGPE
jgi:general stress protein YciG